MIPNINFVFLGLAFILVLSYWIFVFIIFYHLVRFGVGTLPKKLSAVFILGSLVTFTFCIFTFSTIDFGGLSRQTIQSISNSLQQ